jgi:hypothetical protein
MLKTLFCLEFAQTFAIFGQAASRVPYSVLGKICPKRKSSHHKANLPTCNLATFQLVNPMNKYLLLCLLPLVASAQNYVARVSQMADQIDQKVIGYRRHFHQNPELSNREVETAKFVADKLKALGLEVQTGVAKTGVVALLKGGKPGPCVALRADMDALPVPERAPLPFASKAKGEYNGQEVPVMHACGHDTHMAMLLGAAEILTTMRKDIKGTVKFIFQPAEEGAPRGEEG